MNCTDYCFSEHRLHCCSLCVRLSFGYCLWGICLVPKWLITSAHGATCTTFLVKQWNSVLFDEPTEFWVSSGLQHCTVFFFPVDEAILETKCIPQMSRGGHNKPIRGSTTLPWLVGYVTLVAAVVVVGWVVVMVVVVVVVVWLIWTRWFMQEWSSTYHMQIVRSGNVTAEMDRLFLHCILPLLSACHLYLKFLVFSQRAAKYVSQFTKIIINFMCMQWASTHHSAPHHTFLPTALSSKTSDFPC
jgi:hypothetical protein